MVWTSSITIGLPSPIVKTQDLKMEIPGHFGLKPGRTMRPVSDGALVGIGGGSPPGNQARVGKFNRESW